METQTESSTSSSDVTPDPVHITLPSTTVILPKHGKQSTSKYSCQPMPRVVTLAPPQRNSQASLSKVSQSATPSNKPLSASTTADDVLEQFLSYQPNTLAKITLRGRPMMVNGELGVFIPNSLLERPDVDVTIQTESQLQESPTKWRRTVGISSANDVPTEIGPLHVKDPQMISWNSLGTSRTMIVPPGKVLHTEHSTQTTEEDFYDFNAFREKYLPRSEKYSYNYTGKEGTDLVVFRMTGVTCKETMKAWVDALESICNVHYRVWKTYKPAKDGVYKVDLRCHMNQGTNHKTMKGKDFGCRSMLAIKVDPPRVSRGAALRAIRERFRCRVRFRYVHNHTTEQSLKNLSVRRDIQVKIMEFFKQGMSISDAYSRHYQDLKSEHGDKYYEMLCNRSLCPDKAYFYSAWKTFCMANYGKVVKPPKSSIPKVPWNKGLKGITSLKQFLPPEDHGCTADSKELKGEPSKKDRIRRAAIEGIETSLMESIRQNPETYSRAVSSFSETWRSMDDRDRLSWLQLRTVDNMSQKIVLFSPEQLGETMEATDSINFIEFTGQPSYPDAVIGEDQYDCDTRKHLKIDEQSSADCISEFTLCSFPD